MMKTISLAGIAALLAACETVPVTWQPEFVPVVVTVPAEAPQASRRRLCAPMSPAVTEEARRLTLLDKADTGAVDLTAALMVSEIHKNERLREAARAYEACRLARN
jgi:hypothetical protein